MIEKKLKCWKCNKQYKQYEGNVDDYCKRCNNNLKKSLEKSLKEIKEGRTYIMYCRAKKNKCLKSKCDIGICFSCHTKECEKWYNLGIKDARKSWWHV